MRHQIFATVQHTGTGDVGELTITFDFDGVSGLTRLREPLVDTCACAVRHVVELRKLPYDVLHVRSVEVPLKSPRKA